uniref:Uncharacterized protein n=1 Tax=Arundo donax TaxID=35708 RepID=A0A0A9CB12_ARUDO
MHKSNCWDFLIFILKCISFTFNSCFYLAPFLLK